MTCNSKKCKNEREEFTKKKKKKTVSENCHHVRFGNDGTDKNTESQGEHVMLTFSVGDQDGQD